MKKKLFLAALVALTLVSCEEKQSEFVLDGKVQTATITGKVTWPNAEGKMVAKDSVQVRAIVANAEYSAGAAGDKQFTPVLSDKDGFYTLTVPVGQAGISNVSVEIIPFQGKYTDPNSKVEQTVYYTSGRVAVVGAGVTLNPGDVKNVDIQAMPELTFREYTGKVVVSGVVTVDAGVQKVDGGFEKAVIPYVNKLHIKGSYTIDGAATDFDFEDITTSAEGAYSFEVPAGAANAAITISTVRFDGTYTKLVDGELKTEEVYFEAKDHTFNVKQSDEEIRNENFTVTAYKSAAVDQSKEYVLNKFEATVFTWGEVADEDGVYKVDSVFNAFDVQVTFSSAAYDADPTKADSPINGNELTFNTKASTKGGKVTLSNVKLYSEWEGYTINVKIYVPDLQATFTHHFDELAGFSTKSFAKKTWAQWHVDDDVTKDLRETFWSQCWPRDEDEQKLTGHYLATTANLSMTSAQLYYKEFTYSTPVFVKFEFRESDYKAIKGIWTDTKNDYDEELDSYPKLKAPDEAKDQAGETWADWYVSEYSSARQQDKYQTKCETDLKSSKFSHL